MQMPTIVDKGSAMASWRAAAVASWSPTLCHICESNAAILRILARALLALVGAEARPQALL